MDEREYQPTNLEVLISLLEKTGAASRRGVGKTVSVRVGSIELATIDALATIAEKSRNSMMLYLIDVALEQVYAAANDETKARVDELRIQALKSDLESGSIGDDLVEAEKEPLHGHAHA